MKEKLKGKPLGIAVLSKKVYWLREREVERTFAHDKFITLGFV